MDSSPGPPGAAPASTEPTPDTPTDSDESGGAGGSDPTSGGRTSLSALAIGFAATAVGLIYGYDTGAVAGALLFLKEDFGLSTTMQEVVTSAVVVGSIVGAMLARTACDRLGRRRTMVLVALGYVVFAALSGLAPDTSVLVAARFLLGIAVGGSVVAAPIFIGESVAARIRGKLLVTYQMATTIGIAAAYFTDLAFSGSGSWRWMLGVSAIPAALVTLLIIRLPETGHWHLMRGRPEQARASLARTRRPEEIDVEMAQIRQSLAAERNGTLRELFRPPYRRAGVFVAGLGFFVQITGISAIVAYSPMIFQAVGFTSDRAAIAVTALVQLAAIVGEILALNLVERGGRRPTLLTGISLMVLANLVLVLVFATGVGSGSSGVVAVCAVVLFRIGYSAGFGALVWVYASEALPARLRSTGASTLLAVDLLANFLISITFLSALTSLGGTLTFGIFLALCLAAGVFIYVLAPETRGRGLEEIQRYWENGGRWVKK